VWPEPRQDLSYALQRGTYALEHGMRTGVPEAHLDLLRNFMNACDDYLKQAAAEVAPTPAMQDASAAQSALGVPMPPGAMGPVSPQGIPGLPPVGAPGTAGPPLMS
jgi:hypothetical protein